MCRYRDSISRNNYTALDYRDSRVVVLRHDEFDISAAPIDDGVASFVGAVFSCVGVTTWLSRVRRRVGTKAAFPALKMALMALKTLLTDASVASFHEAEFCVTLANFPS